MKLNKNIEYGILLVLYLHRAGRATIKTVSEVLRLSFTFLQQVALKLKLAGVVKSLRGPGGGYEVVKNPTVLAVFNALGESYGMNANAIQSYARGDFEKRALSYYFHRFGSASRAFLSTPVKDLGIDLVEREMNMMDKSVVEGAAH